MTDPKLAYIFQNLGHSCGAGFHLFNEHLIYEGYPMNCRKCSTRYTVEQQNLTTKAAVAGRLGHVTIPNPKSRDELDALVLSTIDPEAYSGD